MGLLLCQIFRWVEGEESQWLAAHRATYFMGGKITAAYKMAKTGLEMARMNEKLSEDEAFCYDEAY